MIKKITLFVAILLLVSCSSVLLTGRKQLLLVSDAEVLSLSLTSYQTYMQTAIPSKKTLEANQVLRVGQKITTAVESYLSQQGLSEQINGYSWEFRLVKDTSVNAFCMPGGKVVVYEGILPVTKTEAGLAVVIGHEIAHAVAKHANERMSNQLLTNYGTATLNGLMSKSPEAAKTIGNTVFGLGAEYGVALPFSRKQEYEADRLGLIFMAMAGYDPAQAVSFWERMTAQSKNSMPEFLSTHPSDAKRIAKLKELLPEALTFYKK
jgi:predicted Zn-dependent protease